MAVHLSHTALPAPRFDVPTRLLVVVAPFYQDIADGLQAGAAVAIARGGRHARDGGGARGAGTAGSDPAGEPVGAVRRLSWRSAA